jgi:signal transduction histidine kinase
MRALGVAPRLSRHALVFSGDRLEAGWLAFAVANLAAMEFMIRRPDMDGWQTVPFHFIYVSFTILFGLRAWKARNTALGMVFVASSTALLTLQAVHEQHEALAELTEVPLMTLMFGVMVFHVVRRQQATALAERLAGERQQLLDREHAFISDASHELLTPLTIGRGHLELLRRQATPSGADVRTTCEVALGELGRMERLVNRLLLLESSVSPEFLRPEPTDAGGFVRELFGRWRSTPERCWRLPEVAEGTVPADVDQMTLALDGVLENAVVHTRPGDSIELRSSARDGDLVLRVCDSGPGIDPALLPHVFERFFRGARGRSRRNGGAGLGLAVAKAIVTAHGGRIAAANPPGGGALFEIRLPGLRPAAEPVAGAAHGLDGDERVELAPQARDAHLDDVRPRVEAVVPDGVQDALPRDDLVPRAQ